MNDWLMHMANELGCDETLDNEEMNALLAIARIAAHTSDDRRNAPLLTYLIGRSRGDRPLSEILTQVQSASTS
ncbi:MAG: DUF6457 domain-containing protein [Gaiellaceae bacterium]